MKKLKKIWVLALLAAGFAMVLGCSNGSGSTDGSGDGTGTGTGTGDQTASGVVTVFDPATYTGDAGKVVEKDGVKYLEITPDKYNTSFTITEVDIKGKTTVKCMVYAKEAKDNVQAVVKLMNAAGQGFANPILNPITAAPAEAKANILSKADRWDDDSEKNVTEDVTDFKCVKLNPFTQETADNWPAQNDVTIYIGKITAE